MANSPFSAGTAPGLRALDKLRSALRQMDGASGAAGTLLLRRSSGALPLRVSSRTGLCSGSAPGRRMPLEERRSAEGKLWEGTPGGGLRGASCASGGGGRGPGSASGKGRS